MPIYYTGFEWDLGKAASNLAKHGVAFEEAATSFDDVHARVIGDPDHSSYEDRFILLGLSARANLLIVSHCIREPGRNIRIISARKAAKNEATAYWRFRNES